MLAIIAASPPKIYIKLQSPPINFQMLKHVQISPLRSRSDSVSLRSSTSFSSNSSCTSSLRGSPELSNDYELKMLSRSSSYSSLNESLPQVRNAVNLIVRQLKYLPTVALSCHSSLLRSHLFVWAEALHYCCDITI